MQSTINRLIIISILFAILGSCSYREKHDARESDSIVMLRMLDSISKNNANMNNPFAQPTQLGYFENEVNRADSNIKRRLQSEYFKGIVLLKMGRERDAIDCFTQVAKNPQSKNDNTFKGLEDNLGVAYLRFGERTNCIGNHMAESCVFPIKDGGIHIDETGSQKAIACFEDLLKKDTSDLSSRWLLNIAYMTLGEYPGKVPPALLIPGLDSIDERYAVKPFKDIASELGLAVSNRAGGAIVDDFNNDGYLDIIISDWELGKGRMHFFKNNGASGFEDVTYDAGLNGYTGGLNMIQADYNNDGWVDFLVLRGAWLPGQFGKQPRTLFRNNGDGTFTDVTIQSGLLSLHPTQTAVWKDFNNDGWLDLFIGDETTNWQDPQPCELYINNGEGGFVNLSVAAGTDVVGFVKGVNAADYNNDGWQDIFISTLDGKHYLLQNEGIKNGAVHFKDVTHQARLDDINARTFPTWFWDYDNDGWPDIFICGYDPGNRNMAYAIAAEALNRPLPTSTKMYLYHNNHDGTFTNVSRQSGLDKTVFAMGSNFGDFDNDGWLDMYLGTGNPDYKSLMPNKLFKNVDGQKFVDVTASARMGNLQKGHGVSFADIDNDGDQDIFTEIGGAYEGDSYYNSLYVNPGQNNNKWITVQLVGNKSNRSAIGARIKLSFTENGVNRVVYRDENSGGSFGCSPLRKEIGIGQAKKIDELSITWPATGDVQVFKNITPNQFIRIVEGDDHLYPLPQKTIDLEKVPKNMMNCAPTQVSIK